MFDRYFQVSYRLNSCKKIKKAHSFIISDTCAFNAMGKVNYKSQSTMADECGVSLRTINTAIKELRSWGILTATEAPFKETLKLKVSKAGLLKYIAENESKKVRKTFNEATEEDLQSLIEHGWLDSDTQNLHNDTQNLHNGCEKVAHNKTIYNTNYKNIPNHNRFETSFSKRADFSDDELKDSCKEKADANEGSDKLSQTEEQLPPFTENPYMVNPAQQVKEKRLFVDQLENAEQNVCTYAMKALSELSQREGYKNIYLGSLTESEWAWAERSLWNVIECDARSLYENTSNIEFVEWLVKKLYLIRHQNKESTGLTAIASMIEAIADDNQDDYNLVVELAEQSQ